LTKVRVRGIYATALSHLFLKNGYKIVQPSDVIADRLNISFDNSPPDATVKDVEDDSILVIGKPYEARSVFHLLSKSLKFV
jgi:Ribonuclease G/E